MKDHISVSQMNLYMMCSLKYRFQYIDQLPRKFTPSGLAFGSAIHSAIEFFNQSRFEGNEPSLSQIKDYFEADWYSVNCENVTYKNGDSLSSLFDLGQTLIEIYYNSVNGDKVAAVEYPFEVPIMNETTGEVLDLPLVGRFDLVEQGPTIVDLKTAARKMPVQDVEQNLQMTAYSYAYWVKNGRLPNLRLDVLMKNKNPKLERIVTNRTKSNHQIFFHLAHKIYEGIKNNIFYPHYGWQCGDCEYKQQCWMFGGHLN